MTRTVQIDYDEELLRVLKLTPEEFASQVRFILAAKLYELGRLSSGQAAQLCGMSRVQFLLELPKIGVNTSNLAADALDEETPVGGR